MHFLFTQTTTVELLCFFICAFYLTKCEEFPGGFRKTSETKNLANIRQHGFINGE